MTRSRALVLADPKIATQYSPRNEVPIEEATLSYPERPWWRCRVGHEWQDATATRRSVGPKWKAGDPLACPHCAGLLVTHVCGHVTRHQPGAPGDPSEECWSCRSAEWRAEWLQDEPRRRQRDAVARSWLAEVPEPDAPETLLRLLRDVRQRHVWLMTHDVDLDDMDRVRDQVMEEAERITIDLVVPSMEVCERSFSVALGAKQAWGPGLARYLGAVAEQPSEPTSLAGSLESFLLRNIGQDLALSTKWLTAAVRAWAYDRGDSESRATWWSVYRELTIPVVPEGRTLWGRIDVMCRPPEGPDLAIEIDQTHNDRSIEKLAYAYEAGAAPIWVRWGGGRLEGPAWLPTIDLRSAGRRGSG